MTPDLFDFFRRDENKAPFHFRFASILKFNRKFI